MPSNTVRRPVPALIALLALTLLAALVWWRVINRDPGSHGSHSGTKSTSQHQSTAPASGNTLPAPTSVTVRVINATGRTGLAAKTCRALAHDAFTTAGVNDEKAHAGVQIRYGAGQLGAAKLLQYYFPGATLVPKGPADPEPVVVSVGGQFHKVATQTSVRAAQQADNVTAAKATGTPAAPNCNKTA